ncbi:MAG TPA: transglycosylase SLT domain-containing protein [Terriglobia bacterium]|nr:transglycosylase SLT domain-containing protein [Terriglobia bacterium]
MALFTTLMFFAPVLGKSASLPRKRSTSAAGKPILYELASRAARKSGWPALRRYAESTKDREHQGLAYFTLGYREYEAGEYGRAETDLGHAVSTRFSLSDLAVYYEAEAAQAMQQAGRLVEILDGFSARFPHSVFQERVLALLAGALLQVQQPERAIEALAADPNAERRPALALLLARAYWQEQKLVEAARLFEHVYYGFPVSPQSDIAETALEQLRQQLGGSFPSPTEQTESQRAQTLFNDARYGQALAEYQRLLAAHPGSPQLPEWTVARARCLVHLKRFHDAVDALSANVAASPEADGERLAALVDLYARTDDPGSMLIVLEQLRSVYPQSSAYQGALSRAGIFYVAQGDWVSAARYYKELAASSAATGLRRDADWRAAWAEYLNSEDEKASQAFEDHLKRYPDSAHAPAAVYWLGRLAEKQGNLTEARAFFELDQRFGDGYYPLEASQRLKVLGAEPARRASSGSRAAVEGVAEPTALKLPLNPPSHRPPSARLCPATPAESQLSPAVELMALSLDDLAERYLKDVLSVDPHSTAALLALTRLEAEQQEYSAALFDAKKLVPDYFDYQFSELPKDVWQWLYPRAFWNIVERQARLNRLDPYLVMALIRQESAFNPQATSVANARGLMQMLPATATPSTRRRRRQRTAQRLYNPGYNITLACRYLRELLRAFHGNVEETLAAYNAGDFRVNDWLKQRSFREPAEFVESIPFLETRLYVETVLRDQAIYRRLLAGSVRFMNCH